MDTLSEINLMDGWMDYALSYSGTTQPNPDSQIESLLSPDAAGLDYRDTWLFEACVLFRHRRSS